MLNDLLLNIASSREHITKGVEYDTLMRWLKEGLLTSRGIKWHARRKILTPTFHFKILEDCLPVMYENSVKLANKLSSFNDLPVDINEFITLCSLDIICEAALGIKLNSQDNQSLQYVHDIKRVCNLMAKKEVTFYLRNDFIFNFTPTGRELFQLISRLQRFTEQVILERKQLFKQSDISQEGKRMAFLDCLLYTEMKNPGTFTMSDIQEEVDTFTFEGHDTTSTALVFCLMLLGLHPQVQEKAVNELKEIFGDSERSVTTADLQRMKYLEMIIKETLRLFPSVPLMTRHLDKDLILEDETLIPAGTNLLVLPYLVHRDPILYDKPNHFIPERFTPENSKSRHPFAYIPFSAGPRNCIGQKFAMMEMKVVVSTILRQCHLESVTKMESLKLLPLVILRPEDPILVKCTRRDTLGSS
ncbi:hypothetical protein O3M35_002949 [Rhynocoris fuscipes]|uniref:Uncharacterized protein n=1 Tax=Rhynocoris fuscipes TaxID=488301 RepID=A0AAW1CLB6_9HEMI